MSFSCLNNNRGFTIAELVVALGIGSILLVFVVTGSLFVQNYLKKWRQKDIVSEELVYLQRGLTELIRSSRTIVVEPNGITFTSSSNVETTYVLNDRSLLRNGKTVTRLDLGVNELELSRIELLTDSSLISFPVSEDRTPRGLYKLILVVSDTRGQVDTLSSVTRNHLEYFKYSQ